MEDLELVPDATVSWPKDEVPKEVKKIGRPRKVKPEEPKSKVGAFIEGINKTIGAGLETTDLDDPDVVKARDQLRRYFLASPKFFPGLTEKKIDKLATLEDINKEIELSQLRMLGGINETLTGFALRGANYLPKYFLHMNEEQAKKLDDNVEKDEALNAIVQYSAASGIINAIPMLMKCALLYAKDVAKVYMPEEPKDEAPEDLEK